MTLERGAETFKLEGGVSLGSGAAIIPANETCGPPARGEAMFARGEFMFPGGYWFEGGDCGEAESRGSSGEWGATKSCFFGSENQHQSTF